MKQQSKSKLYMIYAFALIGLTFIAAKLYEKITKKKLAWL